MYSPQPPRYRKRGMSSAQTAILVVLVVGNLIVLGVGGILVFDMLNAAPQEIVAPPPIYTQPPTATPGPTAAIVPSPTPTLWPTAQPIPGWVQVVGQGVSLWLPDGYDGGNPMQDLDTIMDRYIDAGGHPKYKEKNKESFIKQGVLLFGFAPPPQEYAHFMIWVTVYHETVSGPVSADSLLSKNLAEEFGTDYRIVGREEMMFNGMRVLRLLAEIGDVVMGDYDYESAYKEIAFYYIKNGNDMWILRYSCDRDYFNNNLPTFDKSAGSFHATAAPSITVSTEDWVISYNGGTSLLMPPSFEGRVIARSKDIDDLIEYLDPVQLDYDLGKLREILPATKSLFFFHDLASTTKYVTWGTLLSREIAANETLDSYAQTALSSFSAPGVLTLSHEDIAVGGYPAKHLIFEQQVEGEFGIRVRDAFFFIQVDNILWELHFQCEVPVFEEMNPVFDLIANSFSYSASGGPPPTEAPVDLLATENWITFESSRASIMLPTIFDGGDMTRDSAAIIARYGNEPIFDDTEIFFFTTAFATLSSSGYIMRDSVPADVTLDDMAWAVSQGLGPSMQLVNQETVTINQYTARRMDLQYTAGGATLRLIHYFVRDGNTVWIITFLCDAADFPSLSPIFRLSANTFTIK